MNFSYLATPYSVSTSLSAHQATILRDVRYRKACRMAAELMKAGELIYCPIAHSHSIEQKGMFGEVNSGDFWLRQDFAILQHAKELLVFMMSGWENSKGVAQEIKFAQDLNIPIRYLEDVSFSMKKPGVSEGNRRRRKPAAGSPASTEVR
jgi:hypothetical protein